MPYTLPGPAGTRCGSSVRRRNLPPPSRSRHDRGVEDDDRPGERWAAAHWWRASGRIARNRQALYGGSYGLRIVCFHETLSEELEQVKRIVEWWGARFAIASPEHADALFEGRYPEERADRLLITFDDGLESNYEAARWLADVGVRAVFFVVPSLIGRTMKEYLRFHRARGVEAHAPLSTPGARGLTASQVREMLAMGHRIGAHNYAHRDLGKLHDPESIRYEVANALDAVGEITGSECLDFAIGFGQPENVSKAGAEFLLRTCPRVYACHRGLNVPGRTPRFLLRHAFREDHPMAFTRVCLQGGADRHLSGRAKEMARRVGVLPAPAVQRPNFDASRTFDRVE